MGGLIIPRDRQLRWMLPLMLWRKRRRKIAIRMRSDESPLVWLFLKERNFGFAGMDLAVVVEWAEPVLSLDCRIKAQQRFISLHPVDPGCG